MEQVQTDVETRPEARPRPGRSAAISSGVIVDRRGDRDNRPESFEQMLRRFKKSVDNAGILKEVRARSFFESKSQKARRKAAKAARRRTRNKNRSAES